MRPIMTREGMTLTRIAVDRRVWLLSKGRFNLRLCSLGNELILLGDMHENGRMKPIYLSQIFVSIGAVIPNRGVNPIVADSCHEDHQRAEAKAVVPVGLGGDVQVDARLLPPVQVWSERDVTLFRQFIAVPANVGVHPEQLLQNDNGRSRYCLWPRDIGGELAVLPSYGDVIFHGVLLRQLS